MRMPAAEIEIGADLVRGLLARQHPDLAGLTVTPVANGWDNAVFRLGDELCVRLPRRAAAVDLLRNEQRWLPSLARLVSVPVPAPVRVGEPDAGYPWPWTVCPWLDGRLAVDVPVSRRASIAGQLAGFFADLHAPAAADAPHNPDRGVALAVRDEAVRQRLGTPGFPHGPRLRALWDELVAVPVWPGPPVWVHGDPHPANLLLHGDRLAAVLDFGDLTGGDPATDYAAAWFTFGEAGRAAFRAELVRRGAVDAATWARARGWALNVGTAIVAHSDDNPAMAEVGAHAVAQVLRG